MTPRRSRTASPHPHSWAAIALAIALAGSLQIASLMLSERSAPLAAQTAGTETPQMAAARAAIETISNCDASAPVPGEPQPLGLFQRANYTLWAQILTATSPDQGIANDTILGQVYCRLEQTFGPSMTPDLLRRLHDSHVSIVSFLAAWHTTTSQTARANFLGLLRAQLDTEQQIIATYRAQAR
jgi:hypothetical protein